MARMRPPQYVRKLGIHRTTNHDAKKTAGSGVRGNLNDLDADLLLISGAVLHEAGFGIAASAVRSVLHDRQRVQ